MTYIGSRSVRALLFAVAMGTMLAASPAFADAGTQTTANLNEAKKHYGEGEKKFKAADYAGALTEFQAADGIKSTPQSQRYIGLCEDNLGHYAAAVSYYEKFLTAVPDKLKKEGEEIRTRVGVIKAMPARIHVETTPAGAAIVADGKAMGVTPTDVELAPGKHIVHIELAGYLAIDRDVDLTFGAKQEIKSELQAKPVEQTPVATTPVETTKPVEPLKPEPPKEKQSKLPAFITGGLAIVAIGIGTGFGIAALSTHSQFIATPTSDLADQGENFALVADMAFGVAITLGVTSAVLFLTNDDEPATPPAKTAASKKTPIKIIPTPFFTHNGGGAGAFLRF